MKKLLLPIILGTFLLSGCNTDAGSSSIPYNQRYEDQTIKLDSLGNDWGNLTITVNEHSYYIEASDYNYLSKYLIKQKKIHGKDIAIISYVADGDNITGIIIEGEEK